jgi:hypothetical protein
MTSQTLIATLTLCLSIAFTPTLVAADISIDEDGWYRWEVPAGAGGEKSCCYRFDKGNVYLAGCRLGHGLDEFDLGKPCDVRSDTMQIFVKVKDRQVREIRPLSSACPIKTEAEVITLENVTEAQSIAWLEKQIDENPKVADEAVMTLSFHTRDVALQALFDLIENRNQPQDNREDALFWLIQSDYDEAFAYLDELLD